MMEKASLPPPSPRWAYFLDVDGTLLEFADSPSDVQVDDVLPGFISAVSRRCNGALALISGRSLYDLDLRLGMPELPMAGQHGLERRDGFGRVYRHTVSPVCLKALAAEIASLCGRHPGLLLEDKGATLAVHYRRVPRLGGYVYRLLADWVERNGGGGLQLQKGKHVIEVKPAGYDKGSAIREFMTQAPFSGRRPVFIGDDLTDEHGFAYINNVGGISVKVGSGRTEAHYRLPNVSEVRAWLSEMLIEQPSRCIGKS